MTVRTERSEVRTKTTEGQYSPVRPEQARLVSSLLYGTQFLIVKCNFWWLALKKRSSSSSIFEISEKVISLASAGSFNVKNDNFHTFFFAALVANVEFAGFAPKLTKIHGLDRVHGNGPYCKILTEKEPIRAQGFALDWVCHIIINSYSSRTRRI